MMAYPALSTIKRLILGKAVPKKFGFREEADCDFIILEIFLEKIHCNLLFKILEAGFSLSLFLPYCSIVIISFILFEIHFFGFFGCFLINITLYSRL